MWPSLPKISSMSRSTRIRILTRLLSGASDAPYRVRLATLYSTLSTGVPLRSTWSFTPNAVAVLPVRSNSAEIS
jgi:hypothetical protein